MLLSFKAMGGPIRLDQTHHGRPITIISFHLQPSALFVVEVSPCQVALCLMGLLLSPLRCMISRVCSMSLIKMITLDGILSSYFKLSEREADFHVGCPTSCFIYA